MNKLRKTLLICLTALSTSCASFPKLHPHVIEVAKNQCIPCDLDQTSMTVSCHADQVKPLAACEGFIGFPPKEAADTLSWVRLHQHDCPAKDIQ